MKNLIYTLFLISNSMFCLAQTGGGYKYASFNNIDVTEKDSLLKDPWVGGLNNPQFSAMDVNLDHYIDLVVFDRDGQNLRVFINDGDVLEEKYHYAPEFTKYFPADVNDWLLIRDYNNDDKPDLFTNNHPLHIHGNGIKVYKNVSDSVLKFELVTDFLPAVYNGTNPSTVFVRSLDIPSIEDIDNDGDLDILAQSQSALSYQYYENRSANHDSLDFYFNEECWGHFFQWFDGTVNLNYFCKSGGNPTGNPVNRDGGYSVLTIDLNGDNVKEAIIGDPDRPNMIMLTNGGTPTTAHMTSVNYKYPFPMADSIDMKSFPAAYYEDVNNNGTKDLIVAPNQHQGCVDTGTVWLYTNFGLENLPNFHLTKKNFLSEHMMDFGTMSIPTFADISGDNIPDMLVGNIGYFQSFDPSLFIRTYKSQIAYYKNIGTATEPEYKLITRDLANVGARDLTRISPAFADLDGDGDNDMLFGEVNGNLNYYENTAPIGDEANFVLKADTFMNQNFGVHASPFIMDVDKDGLLDLMVGQKNGNIRLYLNQGTASAPLYNKSVTDTLGGVFNYEPTYENNAVPYVGTIEGDTNNILIVGTYNGWLRFYKGIDTDYLGTFTEVDSIKVSNGPIAAFGVNLNLTDSLELVIGERSGGLSMMHLDSNDYYRNPFEGVNSISEISLVSPSFYIYPNPNNGNFNIRLTANLKGEGVLSIYDLSGKKVKSQEINFTGFKEDISIESNLLKQGVYLVTIEINKTLHRQKLIIQ
ncbi:MAG: T9SS type A sorting domain-containing protein [Salibacteraceae bacterium]